MDSIQKYNFAQNIIAQIKRRIYELSNSAPLLSGTTFGPEPDIKKEIEELKEMLLYWQGYLNNIDSWGYQEDPFEK